ncbi:MAG: hypothetical protein U0975_03230 [Erythrobacter sp.]|nr:hypothetical protein [Erythrobacter sp.]MDZ4271662.1 hypothetical protein [Erythrobacter sp.]
MITPLLDPTLITATSGLIATIVIAAALLRAWNGWLELKRQELERSGHRPASDEGSTIGGARIELADLKERIRKLEAIASGVEL